MQVANIMWFPSVWFWVPDKFVNPSADLWWIVALLSCCFPTLYDRDAPRSSPCLPGRLSGTRRGQLGTGLLGEQSPALRLPGCSLLARIVHTNVKDADLFPSHWSPRIGSACCTHNSPSLPLSCAILRWVDITLGSYLAHCSFPANSSPQVKQDPAFSAAREVRTGVGPGWVFSQKRYRTPFITLLFLRCSYNFSALSLLLLNKMLRCRKKWHYFISEQSRLHFLWILKMWSEIWQSAAQLIKNRINPSQSGPGLTGLGWSIWGTRMHFGKPQPMATTTALIPFETASFLQNSITHLFKTR